MASRQPKHVEEINKTTQHNLVDTADQLQQQQQHDDKNRGVMGSVMQTVKDTYENAKEAVVGKRNPTDSHTTREVVYVNDDDEVRDISANKSRGVYDAAAQKGNEYAGYAGEKAKEATDKAEEYKDYAAEKAKEGKDATMNKMGEYMDYTAEKAKQGKDTAVDAAKKAMGYLGDKKEEAKQKAAETAEAAKQKTAETAEAAKQKTAETAEAAKQKTAEAKDKTKEMLNEADEEARRKKDGGFGEETWRRGNEGVIRTKDTRTKDTRTGAVAEKLKAADQMTGQTFNDVGPLDDEGVTRVGYADIKKK